MTLDEAIRHCKEVAQQSRRIGKRFSESGVEAMKKEGAECDACAAEHEQLAKWLEELQQRRGRARELEALEKLRQEVNETGRVRGISGTIVQSQRPSVAYGVRAAIAALIDMTTKETAEREESGEEAQG